MDALMLCYRGEPLREFPLDGRPIEVGSAADCDIVVHDAQVPAHHLVVWQKDGIPVLYEAAAQGSRSSRARPLSIGRPVEIGRHHSLVRIADAAPRPPRVTPCTETMSYLSHRDEALGLLVGRGDGARRLSLDGWPLLVGSGAGNDLVLSDRAVSKRHCRIEAVGGQVRIRDLGSRNGTWVDGVRVASARVGVGASIRVGRTDLRIVARGSRGDARSVGLVAESPSMLGVLGEVERMARLSWPVLVQGESGAGKEGIARALHQRGPRSGRPFVAINAGGLPRQLVESELFGHERGAFTGAAGQHRGVFEQADGGTLFLDEVAELPLDLQTRLLRVLEGWQVRRVGAEESVAVDVRLVCATHRDLRAMVSEGTFREDLFYRVARLVIDVPPLRERPEDVRALAEHFLADAAQEVGSRRLTDASVGRLMGYGWPGNARELRNVICAAAASTPTERIDVHDVDRAMERVCGPGAGADGPSCDALSGVLERYGGNLSAAARALGMPRSTLRDRLKGVQPARPAGGAKAAGGGTKAAGGAAG